jgi:hypothetical protein
VEKSEFPQGGVNATVPDGHRIAGHPLRRHDPILRRRIQHIALILQGDDGGAGFYCVKGGGKNGRGDPPVGTRGIGGAESSEAEMAPD